MIFREGFSSSQGVFIIQYKPPVSLIGKRVSHSEDNIYGWQKNIKPSQIDFFHPIVLCLGGAGIDDDKSANGIAKIAQILLGRNEINNKEVQLLSAVYPKDLSRLGKERIQFSAGQPREKSDYIMNIYENIFSPIIHCPNNDFNNVRNKLRNITIFSHCHGSFVACELVNYLMEDMKTVKFTDKEISELSGEITSIMLSPRDGVQMADGSLNIGFTMVSDNMEGGIKNIVIKGADSSISDFCDRFFSKKISGSDILYNKYGHLHSFYDSDSFGADIRFILDGDWDVEMLKSQMVYETIFIDKHFHLFENYCSLTGSSEEIGVGTILKNEKGKNFTKIIAKSLQNAVSLSYMGAKRTLKEIVSNDTEVVYRQSLKENNPTFKDIKFTGSLEEFKHNYECKISLEKNLNKLFAGDFSR